MQISNEGFDFITRWEPIRKRAYEAPNGRYYLGYGHHSPFFSIISEMDKKTALELLALDLSWIAESVTHYLSVDVNQHQFDALCDVVLRVGAVRFYQSNLLNRINGKAENSEILRGFFIPAFSKLSIEEHARCVAESRLFFSDHKVVVFEDYDAD